MKRNPGSTVRNANWTRESETLHNKSESLVCTSVSNEQYRPPPQIYPYLILRSMFCCSTGCDYTPSVTRTIKFTNQLFSEEKSVARSGACRKYQHEEFVDKLRLRFDLSPIKKRISQEDGRRGGDLKSQSNELGKKKQLNLTWNGESGSGVLLVPWPSRRTRQVPESKFVSVAKPCAPTQQHSEEQPNVKPCHFLFVSTFCHYAKFMMSINFSFLLSSFQDSIKNHSLDLLILGNAKSQGRAPLFPVESVCEMQLVSAMEAEFLSLSIQQEIFSF